jgi:hypothetical protein
VVGRGQEGVEVGGDVGDGDVRCGSLQAVDDFDEAFCELLADIDTVGHADEFRVLELDAGAFVAFVEEGVDVGGRELGCDGFTSGQKISFADVGDGDDNFVGGDGGGQDVLVGLRFRGELRGR